jgi:deoxyribonuclease-4
MYHILVVDDEVRIRSMIRKYAEFEGHTVTEAGDGMQAVLMVRDGGYDIVNNLDGVLDEFDKVVGLDRLKAIHLNDSMNSLDSHKDRHAKIGEGQIGLDALVRVINHPKLRELPFILETPNEHEGYKQEIALLRSRFVD